MVPQFRNLVFEGGVINPFKDFMGSSFGFIRDIRRLAYKFGYHKGDFFRDWLGGLIQARLGRVEATFADLKPWKAPRTCTSSAPTSRPAMQKSSPPSATPTWP